MPIRAACAASDGWNAYPCQEPPSNPRVNDQRLKTEGKD